MCSPLIHIGYQHDAIEHGHAEPRDETGARRIAVVQAANQKPETPATARQEQVSKNQKCMAKITKRGLEQCEDVEDGKRQHDEEPACGRLLVLELSAPGEIRTGGQLHFC